MYKLTAKLIGRQMDFAVPKTEYQEIILPICNPNIILIKTK
jgi:hypothetical protein